MTLYTATLPANSLRRAGDRLRVQAHFYATAAAAQVGTVKLNGVTVANTSVSSTSPAVAECWLQYVDRYRANLVELDAGAMGALSAVAVYGFDWEQDQDLAFSQNSVASQHLVLFALAVDILPVTRVTIQGLEP